MSTNRLLKNLAGRCCEQKAPRRRFLAQPDGRHGLGPCAALARMHHTFPRADASTGAVSRGARRLRRGSPAEVGPTGRSTHPRECERCGLAPQFFIGLIISASIRVIRGKSSHSPLLTRVLRSVNEGRSLNEGWHPNHQIQTTNDNASGLGRWAFGESA